jgi:hypothetical protein
MLVLLIGHIEQGMSLLVTMMAVSEVSFILP